MKPFRALAIVLLCMSAVSGCGPESAPTGGFFPVNVLVHDDTVWIAASRFDPEDDRYSVVMYSSVTDVASHAKRVFETALPELTGEPIPSLYGLLVTNATSSQPDFWYNADYFKAADYLTKRSADGTISRWQTSLAGESLRIGVNAVQHVGDRDFILLADRFGYLTAKSFVPLSKDARWAACHGRSCTVLVDHEAYFALQELDAESLAASPVTQYVAMNRAPFLAACSLGDQTALVHESGYYVVPAPAAATSAPFVTFHRSLSRFNVYDDGFDFVCGGDGQALIVDQERRVHFFDILTGITKASRIILSRPSKHELPGWPGRPIAAAFDGRSTWYVAASYVISTQTTYGCDTPVTYGCAYDHNIYGLRLWAIRTDGTVLWQKRLR